MGCGRAGKCDRKMNHIGGERLAAIFQICPALNLLKTSGAAFRAHLVETLYDLNYIPTKADPNVWIRINQKQKLYGTSY